MQVESRKPMTGPQKRPQQFMHKQGVTRPKMLATIDNNLYYQKKWPDLSDKSIWPAHDPRTVEMRAEILAGVPLRDISKGTRRAKKFSTSTSKTRLQTLLWSKSASDITDQELFDDGELESYLCDESEVQVRRDHFEAISVSEEQAKQVKDAVKEVVDDLEVVFTKKRRMGREARQRQAEDALAELLKVDEMIEEDEFDAMEDSNGED